MADDDNTSLMRQGDQFPLFGPELKKYAQSQNNPNQNSAPLSPDDEMTIRLLMQPQSFSSSPGIQPNLESPNEIAAARHRFRGGGQGYRGDYTPDQQKQQAENVIGAASIVVPGLGAANELSKGNYGEAAKQAALSTVPFGLGRLGRFAKPAIAGWFGSSLLSPTATAGEKNENPFKWDENSYRQRQKAAQKTANTMPDRARAKFLGDFESREGDQRSKLENNARDWESANQGKTQAVNELEGYKKSVEPSSRVLKPEVQSQIQNAKSTQEASKIYNDAMNERVNLSKTSYEKYGPAIEGGAIGSALLGGRIGYNLASGRAKSLQGAQQAAKDAYTVRYGENAPKTIAGKAARDAELKAAKDQLEGLSGLPQHPGWKTSAGLIALPEATGVLGPNLYDAMLSPYPEVKEKAMNNLIPGYSPSTDPNALFGRDWSALLGHGRALAEGLTAHTAGSALAGARDYEKLQNLSQSTLKSIKDAQDVAAALKDAKSRSTKSRSRGAAPSLPMPNPVTGKMEGDIYQGRSPFQLK